jgi:GNAT superfamily N-acetyltransferase
MLDGAGYAPVRTFYEMVRPTLDGIPDAPLPDGTELRAVLPQHYREIWRSVDETSKDEWGYEPADEEGYQEWLSHPHFQPDLWQIAWDTATNAVAGHLLTFIDHADNAERQRKRGLTEGLGVEQPWRRRGLARALVSRSLQAQAAAGMTESALNADSDNSGKVIALYQSAGFHVTERSTVYRKPL